MYETTLPCESKWQEGIYQIEVTDRATGYNRTTKIDGVANTQATELGNRTLYLRDFLETEHDSEGHHSLKDANFAANSIPEAKLSLAYSTTSLDAGQDETEERLREFLYQANEINNVDLHATNAVRKMIPLTYEYRQYTNEFELFTQEFTIGERVTTKIIGLDDGVYKGAVREDDSLDVESTEGLVVGDEYYVYDEDGGNLETVVVKSVLSEHRVRFVEDLNLTRQEGYLSTSSLYVGNAKATVKYNWKFRSDWMDSTIHAYSAELVVNRDNKTGVTPKAWFQTQEGTGWVEAPLLRQTVQTDGSIDDVFQVPTAIFRFKLDYSYDLEGESPYPYYVNYLAILPDRNTMDVEQIRTPTVTDAVKVVADQSFAYANGVLPKCLKITTDGYGTLYGIRPDGASVSIVYGNSQIDLNQPSEFFDKTINRTGMFLEADFNYLDTEQVVLRVYGPADSFPTIGTAVKIYVRFYDHENSASQWSAAYEYVME